MPVDEPTLTVTELNLAIRDAVRDAFPRDVWVKGEVQGLTRSGMGHSYFQLVEKAGKGERVLSRIDVALFRDDRPAINAALKDSGLKLEPDVEVRIRGRVGFWTPGGKLNLVMNGIDPVFTVGGMAANRERLLKALAGEGLLRANGALAMPMVPLRIGLVTSADTAAYHDFVQQLGGSGFAFRVCLADVRVQGSGAPKRVVWALRQLARRPVDAIVVVRGGGSRSDLAPFDTEDVARAIAAMPVPVVTGIGHEVDRSIADEVAHTACKTPTACAQTLVEHVCEFVDRLDEVSRGVAGLARARCALAAREMGECARRVRRGAPGALVRELGALERRRGRVEELGTRLTRAAAHHLDGGEARLRALDPRRVLERGYSITRDDSGRVLKAVDGLAPEDVLITEFAAGAATSRIESVAPPATQEETDA
ncbi:MAG TPA: exodeoxyribonuclease VII large subunit [Acidimicrobiia bacterium]|nr:exodeoxyribonuclease VII large subunit [Acidimicrobiia bacterium]